MKYALVALLLATGTALPYEVAVPTGGTVITGKDGVTKVYRPGETILRCYAVGAQTKCYGDQK